MWQLSNLPVRQSQEGEMVLLTKARVRKKELSDNMFSSTAAAVWDKADWTLHGVPFVFVHMVFYGCEIRY